MGEAVRRISAALNADTDDDTLDMTLRKSFVLSSDQAHAVHPNYASKVRRRRKLKNRSMYWTDLCIQDCVLARYRMSHHHIFVYLS